MLDIKKALVSAISPVKRKTAEERAKAIADGLNVTPVSNHSPSYQTVEATHYPSQEQYITVTLDKLRPYEHNPRKTRNPNFDMIKESIRRRGLDHKPNITRRPGEPYYIIADGGNTRIQALKELFTETKDERFWSISCHYKPWKGETADSVEDELNLLIGHLIENDTRADLSFIEKALGIQQAKTYYEQKLERPLSSRELSEQLENDGYIISHTLIAKMALCIEHLYPFIPTVLFNGLGHSQIDKLLAIRNNVINVWGAYQFEVDRTIDSLWGDNLALFDKEAHFQVKQFQEQLITAMLEVLGERTNFEALYLEIDLDEQKFKRLAAKQHEISEKIETAYLTESTPLPKKADSTKIPNSSQTPSENRNVAVAQSGQIDIPPAAESEEDSLPFLPPVSPIDQEEETENSTEQQLEHLIIQNYGLIPGMSVQEQRKQQAQANGLEFACVGRQPVADIWSVYPARKHKVEAYSLALDIAESAGIEELVEHVVKEPADYSYRMKPLEKDLSDYPQFIYDLLQLLQTDEADDTGSCLLAAEFLFSDTTTEPVLSDVVLVKIFRLIRVVRYIRNQGADYA